MKRPHGRTIRLSPFRRVVGEIMHHGEKVPTLAHSMEINVSELIDLRGNLASRPSWLAIFLRAYGLTGQARPQLRQAYLSWPVERLYEHPETVCAVPVEREWRDEKIILFPKIWGPEYKSLGEIHYWLREFATAPLSKVGHFRQHRRMGRLAKPLRRFMFWHSLNVLGRVRAKRFGTCIISSLGDLDCEQNTVITPLTTYFTIGPIKNCGTVRLTIVYDHRVMDGRIVASCLNDIKGILETQVCRELQYWQDFSPQAA